jgi:hypothetical protein
MLQSHLRNLAAKCAQGGCWAIKKAVKGAVVHLHAFSYSFRVRRRSVAWRQFYRSSGPTTGLLQIKMIEKKFGDFPLSALADPRTRSIFKVRSAFGKARDQAELFGLQFNDTRGTAVTRLALTGSTPPEIATITGHSLSDVGAILDAHYLSRDPEMACKAIRKLELG